MNLVTATFKNLAGVRRLVSLRKEGDRIVFSGGLHGEHSLAFDQTNRARLLAHYKGYIADMFENGWTETVVQEHKKNLDKLPS